MQGDGEGLTFKEKESIIKIEQKRHLEVEICAATHPSGQKKCGKGHTRQDTFLKTALRDQGGFLMKKVDRCGASCFCAGRFFIATFYQYGDKFALPSRIFDRFQ